MSHTHRIALLALGIGPLPALAISGTDTDWSWKSADEPAGPPVFWADLESTGGTDLGLSSGSSTTVSLPFNVTLMGTTVNAITVFSDGLVSPASGSGPGSFSSHSCIGDGSTTGSAIAPLWGDWDLSVSGSVWAKTWEDGVIIEWREMKTSSSESSGVDFAVLIRSNGEIAFGYADSSTGSTSTSQGRGAAIGIQDSSGDGVSIGCNEVVLHSADDAIALSPRGTRHLAGEHSAEDLARTWILGGDASDQFGKSLASMGDLDGDGLDDFVVGAPQQDDGGSGAGAIYLFSGTVSEDSEAGSADVWTRIRGSNSSDQAGSALDGGMDMDGDGIPDLVIGVPYEDRTASNAGAAAVFFGETLLSETSLEIDEADLLAWGEASNDYAGSAVAWAGDVDGDGYADLLLGAPGGDGGASNGGTTYLVLGGSSPLDLDLGSADASYQGEAASDSSGSALVGIGDVDGDGYADFAIGAYGQDDGASGGGAVYLVYGEGSPSGSSDLGSEDRATGISATDSAGYALGAAGDLDGDGRDDLLVGAPMADGKAGAAYALLGDDFPSSLSSAWGIASGGSNDRTGASLAGMDLSGSGDRAMVAGGYGDSTEASSGGVLTLLDADHLGGTSLDAEDEAWGRLLGSETTGYLGAAVATGDFDGDGYDDILGGAYGMDGEASASGAVVLISGGTTWPDEDGDGFLSTDWGGIDCDDSDDSLGPTNDDVCDGIDNDCDGTTDNGYSDTDGDGTSDCIDTEECDGIDNDGDGSTDEGYSDTDGDGIKDCVDTEACDGLDNDGDGEIDEGFADTDEDGTPDCLDDETCDGIDNNGDGSVDEDQSDVDGDGLCDDLDSEDCDGIDNDGDGDVDEDFEDADGDGSADCQDGEDCDGIDNDGDGLVDEGYTDTDADGVADCVEEEDCDGLDNDGDGLIDEIFGDSDFDGIADCVDTEECDGIDNDGDGLIDPDQPDSDSDGAADCIDVESCDGLDNDGDGDLDEGFADSDADGIADCVDDTPLGETEEEPELNASSCAAAGPTRGLSPVWIGLLGLLGWRRRSQG